MLLVYLCFSSGVYLYFRIFMYVKRHEQFQIGCGAILNKKYIIKPHCQVSLNSKIALFKCNEM